MLTEYEEKRLEYNLELNDLNKFKKDYENKRIEMTKRKFNSTVKEKEKKVEDLKQNMDKFFCENQEIIVFEMLKANLDIDDEFSFYSSEVLKDENGNYFVNKIAKDDIHNDFDVLRSKVQKRYDNKSITSIIYNDLNRCINLYEESIINKWSSLSNKKAVAAEDVKKIEENLKAKATKKKIDDNWFFVRIMLPIIIIDIICALFMLFNGRGCSIGSSEALSAFLCSFAVVSNIVVMFVTPIVVLYLVVKGIKIFTLKRKK